jgi:hypothetical protein
MKQFKWLGAALVALGLVACSGGDGANSPTFQSELTAITVSPPSATKRVGATQQYTVSGVYTTASGGTETRPVPTVDITWTSGTPTVATIDPSGLATARANGTTAITAQVANQQDSATLTVQPATVVQVLIDVNPSQAGVQAPQGGALNIPASSARTLTAFALYSDSTTDVIPSGDVTWNVLQTNVLSPTNSTNNPFTVTALSGTSGQSATLTATSGGVSSDPLTVNVNTSTLSGVVRVEQVNPTVPPNTIRQSQFTEYQAIGSFSDGGGEAALADDLVNWTSSAPLTAPVNALGIVEGLLIGKADIRADLKNPTGVTGATFAKETLTITDNICLDPLINLDDEDRGVTVEDEVNGLCIGCATVNVANPRPLTNLIDENPINFADMITTLGLLGGKLSVTVGAGRIITPTPAGQRVGFIIARPNGVIARVQLLSGIDIATVFNGVERQSFNAINDSLRLDLLTGNVVTITDEPGIGELKLAYVSFLATQPFDGLKITQNAGVASVIQRTAVFRACARLQLPED